MWLPAIDHFKGVNEMEKKGSGDTVEPYRTNDKLLGSMTGLVFAMKILIEESGELKYAERYRDYPRFEGASEKMKELSERVQTHKSDIEKIITNIQNRIYCTKQMGINLPFLSFCERHGLDWNEQLIVTILLSENGMDGYYPLHGRGIGNTGRTIVKIICNDNLAPEKAIEYLKKGGRLRRTGIIRASGAKPILLECFFELNQEVLKEIYGDDYDDEIEDVDGLYERRKRGELLVAREATVTLDDVILPSELKEAIQNGIIQAKYGEVFLDRMGFRKKFSRGVGITMLFSGPPGTGKTMAAEAVASEIGKKLLTVNYAELESCWWGETEKNIRKCFEMAKKQSAVLLFDEADAVFYRRSDSERSWANRDVNVLLTSIEEFDSVVILTTNFGSYLDPALERRINVKVLFPMPDTRLREHIFRTLAPCQESVEKDIDYGLLAKEYEFSGGQIKNVWINAGRLSLKRTCGSPDTKISIDDILCASEIERKGTSVMQYSLHRTPCTCVSGYG